MEGSVLLEMCMYNFVHNYEEHRETNIKKNARLEGGYEEPVYWDKALSYPMKASFQRSTVINIPIF
jgi:hypothetical protein